MHLNEQELAALATGWDVPVLPITPAIRAKLLRRAILRAYSSGFVHHCPENIVLMWRDDLESAWLGIPSMRGWVCGAAPLNEADLAAVAHKLLQADVQFAALSAWQPFPAEKEFLNVGQSIHSLACGLREKAVGRDISDVRFYTLGNVPNAWIDPIERHITSAIWYDRHARDSRFNSEAVRVRRLTWLRNQLSSGDGLLAVVQDSNEQLAAYMLSPYDRERVACGGPIVLGTNAIAGSLVEGHGYYSRLLAGAYMCLSKRALPILIQYQPENHVVHLLVVRSLVTQSSCRYDVHWWRD